VPPVVSIDDTNAERRGDLKLHQGCHSVIDGALSSGRAAGELAPTARTVRPPAAHAQRALHHAEEGAPHACAAGAKRCSSRSGCSAAASAAQLASQLILVDGDVVLAAAAARARLLAGVGSRGPRAVRGWTAPTAIGAVRDLPRSPGAAQASCYLWRLRRRAAHHGEGA